MDESFAVVLKFAVLLCENFNYRTRHADESASQIERRHPLAIHFSDKRELGLRYFYFRRLANQFFCLRDKRPTRRYRFDCGFEFGGHNYLAKLLRRMGDGLTASVDRIPDR